jgi:cyclophilin family peptidyl-prolyl cis-trans isomerase
VPSDKRARQRAAREARLAAEAKQQKRRKQIRNAIIVVVVAGVIVAIAFIVSGGNNTPVSSQSKVGSTTTSTTTAATAADAKLQAQANAVAVKAGCPASTKTVVNTQKYSAAPAMTIDTSKTYTATVDTTTGTFTITLDAKSAPTTVNNFVFLAQKGFYHCVIFHRVIPQFMDQTGDPTGTGEGGPGYTIPDENPPKAANAADQYPLGSVAMANTGAPHSGGSQFFIVAGPEGESLPNSYALFGSVTSGMNVVDTINQQGSAQGVPPDVTQRIISVTIHS